MAKGEGRRGGESEGGLDYRKFSRDYAKGLRLHGRAIRMVKYESFRGLAKLRVVSVN